MPSDWVNKIRSQLTRQGAESNSSFNAKKSLMWIGLSLVLAGFAQFAFAQGLVLVAVLDFAVAVWIFVANIRPFLTKTNSEEQDLLESSPVAHETQPVIEPGTEPAPSQERVVPGRNGIGGLPKRWGFVKQYWRELTIFEIVTGSITTLPMDASSSATTAPVRPAAVIDQVPESTLAPDQSLSTLDEAGITAQKESIRPRRQGQITRLTGGKTSFSQPSAVVAAPNGDVLVLDVGRELVYRLDPDGEYLGEWSVSGLNQLHVYDLTVSPNGETIYLIDKEDQSVYKIALDK